MSTHSSHRLGPIVMDRLLGLRAATVAAAGGAYLLLAWMLVAVIDVYDVAGLRTTLGRDVGAPAWVHLFGEAGLTEMLQWIALAILAFVAAARAGQLRDVDGGRPANFLAILAVLSALMLIEDAGNPSHRLGVYAEDILGTSSGTVRMLFRLPVFLFIGGLALYAFARYWPSVARARPGGTTLLLGFLAYGWAACSSVPANVLFDFYSRAGTWLTATILGGRLVPIEPFGPMEGSVTPDAFTSVMFMDFVYEESIELIGAALLLAGALALGSSLTDATGTHRGSAVRN